MLPVHRLVKFIVIGRIVQVTFTESELFKNNFSENITGPKRCRDLTPTLASSLREDLRA